MMENINRNCFVCARDSSWSIKEINYLIRTKRLSFYLEGNYSSFEILTRALYYSKKMDYFDKYYEIIVRKNGEEIAYKMFKKIFPKLNSITDLYDYCFKLIIKGKDIKEVSNRIGISPMMIKYYAKQSKIGLLPEDKERIEKKRQNIIVNYPEYAKALQFLLEHDNSDEIISYLQEIDGKVKFNNIQIVASSLYPEKSLDEIKEQILKKYYVYRYYKKHVLNANLKRREEASRIIDDFVSSDYNNISLFCEMKDIEKKIFKWALSVVRLHNKPLYEEYSMKNNALDKQDILLREDLIRVINGITYGIDGREFTIIDFFHMTKLSVSKFFNVVSTSLDEIEYFKVRAFYKRYKDMHILQEKDILMERREVNCEKDENNNLIMGTGHIVTKEEKKEIISLIKEDGLLLYDGVYNCYLKKYFSEKDAKVKKKSL